MGSRRLVAEEGPKSIGDGGRRRLRGIRQQRVSHKSTCFFSICLLFVPSRPLVSSCSGPVGFSSATTAASSSWTAAASLPSSLLASSCSGPSRQDERTTARLIQSPGIGHDEPVSGRVVLPRALRVPPKEKMSKRHK